MAEKQMPQKTDQAHKKTHKATKIAGYILADVLGSLLLSIGIHCFIEEIDIALGGVAGIAIMVKYLSNDLMPIGLTSLLLNVPLLILAYRYMGKRFALRTLCSVAFYTVILDLLVTPFIPQYVGGERILGALFGGICVGGGLGIIFYSGSSTGGTDIVSYLLEKRFPNLPIGKAMLAVDGVVLVASVFVFGNVEAALFGIVTLVVQAIVIDKVVYGSEKGRNILIISERNEVIAQRILTEQNRGATFLDASGAYSGRPTKVLMCVVKRWEYQGIKSIVHEEDPNAFVIASEAEHVMGEGFSPIHSSH